MVSTMFVVPVSLFTQVNNVIDHQANGDTLPADQTFTMQLAVQGMVMGKSVLLAIESADG